jgi:uncharacterized protein with PQ loop repeat
MTILEYIGWSGSICLALCALPQAIKSYKDKHATGISLGFLTLWSLGELLTLIYVAPKMDLPLLTNYLLNIAFLSIIWYYKISDTKELRCQQQKAQQKKAPLLNRRSNKK